MGSKSELSNNGCSAAPDCLNCPLPECRFVNVDGSYVRFQARIAERNVEIRRRFGQGEKQTSLARAYGLAKATIAGICAAKWYLGEDEDAVH